MDDEALSVVCRQHGQHAAAPRRERCGPLSARVGGATREVRDRTRSHAKLDGIERITAAEVSRQLRQRAAGRRRRSRGPWRRRAERCACMATVHRPLDETRAKCVIALRDGRSVPAGSVGQPSADTCCRETLSAALARRKARRVGFESHSVQSRRQRSGGDRRVCVQHRIGGKLKAETYPHVDVHARRSISSSRWRDRLRRQP